MIPNEGKLLWLNWALPAGAGTYESFYAKLYSNNYTPQPTDSAANYTECNFTGYARYFVGRSTFNAPYLTGNVAASTSNTPPVFASTDPVGQTAYGWFLVGTSSGAVVAAQQFANPRSMTAGATETLSPFTIQLATLGTNPPT